MGGRGGCGTPRDAVSDIAEPSRRQVAEAAPSEGLATRGSHAREQGKRFVRVRPPLLRTAIRVFEPPSDSQLNGHSAAPAAKEPGQR